MKRRIQLLPDDRVTSKDHADRSITLVLLSYWTRLAQQGYFPERYGMFSAMLFTISIVALSQFALYYWRAVLAGVAAQPVSERVLAAAQVENGDLSPGHFEALAELHDLTPDLQPNRGGLGLVRIYYRAVQGLDVLLGKYVPAVAAWSERERVICARYAAVQVGRRLQANLELAASLRSC